MSYKAHTLKAEKLDLVRKCYVGVNIQNSSKSLLDISYLPSLTLQLTVPDCPNFSSYVQHRCGFKTQTPLYLIPIKNFHAWVRINLNEKKCFFLTRFINFFPWRHDIWQNDIHSNDTQHNDTQYNGIQDNNISLTTLSQRHLAEKHLEERHLV